MAFFINFFFLSLSLFPLVLIYSMHMNDPKLISAAQQIKPKPDFAQPASNASHHTNPKPQIKVNQNVSKASIALTKPTNSNQNSANYPSSFGYMQPAMYQQQQQPQPQPYYQPYSPPPPPPSKPLNSTFYISR